MSGKSKLIQRQAQKLAQKPDRKTQLNEPSAPHSTSVPKIQPSKRRGHQNLQKLMIWDLHSLKTGQDPLGQGIALLFEQGATQALFLTIVPATEAGKFPDFVGTATIAPQEKLQIWTGIQWNPTIVPEMWNHFVKTGQIELSPPGTVTNLESHRNVVRGAFGIQPQEWLLLLRCGPITGCRGILAIVSKQTLMTQLDSILPLIQADVQSLSLAS
jgi:hypothetical protein